MFTGANITSSSRISSRLTRAHQTDLLIMSASRQIEYSISVKTKCHLDVNLNSALRIDLIKPHVHCY